MLPEMMPSNPGAIANPYEDTDVANFYASIDYTDTYLLAARDLPAIIHRRIKSGRCLDFACGAGRSTRLLKRLGFDVTGVDISRPMLTAARERDPRGAYIEIGDGDLSALSDHRFDLVHSAFPYESIASLERIVGILRQLSGLMKDDGIYICVEPTPDLYTKEWASFTTAAFDANRYAGSGDTVEIAFRSRPSKPVTDILWTDGDYRTAFDAAGLAVDEAHRPLGRPEDGVDWMSEAHVAPFVIYVLSKSSSGRGR
jgi:SAM-dependent methyltransferase